MITSLDPDSDWIPRLPDLPALLRQRSYFLLGPRQTGKTALIHRFPPQAQVPYLRYVNGQVNRVEQPTITLVHAVQGGEDGPQHRDRPHRRDPSDLDPRNTDFSPQMLR